MAGGRGANGARLAVSTEQLTWLKIQPGSVVIAAKFKFVTEGELRQVQLAVDPRLRLLPLPGDAPPSVEVAADRAKPGSSRLRWPRPITDEAVLETAFLFSGASAVGNIRVPRIGLVDAQPMRRWMAVSVDTALDCDERQGERLEPVAAADFLKAWGEADSKPRAAYRLPRGETGWTISTRPHEPRTTADQTLAMSFDEDRIDAQFEARLSVDSGYVFRHQVKAPKDFKIEQVSVMVDDADRVGRWSQDKDGVITVFLNGPASGTERLSIHGQLPICLGEKYDLPLLVMEKCQIHSAIVQLFQRPAVSLTISRSAGVSPAPKTAGGTPTLPEASGAGRLIETVVWDGSRLPPVAVTAKTNPLKGSEQRSTEPRGNEKSPAASRKDKHTQAARKRRALFVWPT